MTTVLVVCLVDFIALTAIFEVLCVDRFSTRLRLATAALAVYFASVWTLWAIPGAWALPVTAIAAAGSTFVFRYQGLAPLTTSLGRSRLPIFLLSVATLAWLVFVSLPVTTFLTSPGELKLHLDYLLRVNARDAMVLLYVAALAYAAAPSSRFRTALTLFALAAVVLGLTYAFALPLGYPPMTGLSFERVAVPLGTRVTRLACDVAAVLAVFFGLRWILLRVAAPRILLSLVLVAASVGAVTALSMTRHLTGGAGGSGSETLAAPLRYSRTHPNVLVIFLDRFMGSYVESILADVPDLAAGLTGFTWYPRTIAAGENSIAGVHPMLGGYDYTPEEMNRRHRPLRDLSIEAFTLLPLNFSKAGYEVNVVNPRGLAFTMAGDCTVLKIARVHCTQIPPSISSERAASMGFSLRELSEASYADLLVLLGAMRSAPYGLKAALYDRGPWRPFMDHSAGTTFRQWAEIHAWKDLSRTDASEPNFNFVSSILPHEPYFLGEDCVPRPTPLQLSDHDVQRRGHTSLFSLQHALGAKCSLLAVAQYLRFLKEAGVYDNTRIAIVSDHGIVGDIADDSSRARAGGTTSEIFVRSRSLLLVKERNARHPLEISERFLPNAELPRIVCEEIGGCVNPYLQNRPVETAGRDDPFVVSYVPWQFTAQKPTSFVIQRRDVLTGKDPYDVNGWSLNARE